MVSIYGLHISEWDYYFILLHKEISEAVQKRYTVDVPFSDSKLDFSYSVGGIPYFENRTITMNFEIMTTPALFPEAARWLSNVFGGQKVTVKFDDDPDYYWEGVATVGALEHHGTTAGITITVDVEPFKKELNEGIVMVSSLPGGVFNIPLRYDRNFVRFKTSGFMTINDGTDTYRLNSQNCDKFMMTLPQMTPNWTITADGEADAVYIRGGYL